MASGTPGALPPAPPASKESGSPAQKGEGFFRLLTTLIPTTQERVREAALSFFLSPLAIVILLLGTTSIISWTAVGQPLSSPEGTLGVALAGILFLRLGASTTKTTAGLIVTVMWSVVFLVLYLLSPLAWGADPGAWRTLAVPGVEFSPVNQLLAPQAWSVLPLLITAVTSMALIATYVVRRHWRRVLAAHPESPPVASGKAQLGIAAVNLLAVTLVWTAVIDLAPRDVADVAVYGPAGLALTPVKTGSLLAAMVGLGMLVISAIWSPLSSLAAAALFMILPAAFGIPVVSSLLGLVASSGDPIATAVALASPVVGALGLLSVSLTWGLYWVTHTLSENAVPRD